MGSYFGTPNIFTNCYWYISKYMWVIPLKFGKGITITTAFPKKKKKKKEAR